MNKNFSRRNFLKFSSASVCSMLASQVANPRILMAEGGTAPEEGKTIVLLIKFGGQDMTFSMPLLNQVADELAKVRPNIHVKPSDALDILNGEIGLHAAYKPLESLVAAGNFKVIQSCGFEKHSRSHQTAQDHMSHGARHLDGVNSTSGWPAKTKNHFNLNTYQLVGFNTSNIIDLRSKDSSLIVGNNLAAYNKVNRIQQLGGRLGTEFSGDILNQMLFKLKRKSPDTPGIQKATSGISTMDSTIENVQAVSKIDVGQFPDTSLGRDFRNCARMIAWKKANFPKQNSIYILKASGYDTHNKQEERLSKKIKEEADAINAFSNYIQGIDLWNKTTLLSISEFSRTLKENSDIGTDHASATNIFLAGGSINGKGNNSVFGPTFSKEDIERNHAPTEIHYTDVIVELLRWWGASETDIATIVPEESPKKMKIPLFV